MSTSTTKQANELAQETSPYLLQHKHNPVNWHPWNKETLATARREGKPVLLSIGYSACHWCHVMAHESFENDKTAEIMNRLFINIKVDREERQDLDQIYQAAYTVLSRRSGGWPLTMFLNPVTLAPFFGGTYFPPEERHGLPAFTTLLHKVHSFFVEQADTLQHQGAVMQDMLKQFFSSTRSADALPPDCAARTSEQLLRAFDSVHGGLGGAPKFPQPSLFSFLLLAHAAGVTTSESDTRPLHATLFTLDKIIRGGLYDHLGGGFFRYCVDELWMIPHFEKMLYDNAQLLSLLTEATVLKQAPHYREAALSTASWMMQEMQHPTGGFFAALDADSENEEGRFYVWSQEEFAAVLNDRELELSAHHFGLDKKENFAGKYHLHAARDLAEVIEKAGLSMDTGKAIMKSARSKLLTQRKLRTPPGLDDNVLCSWNGMTIKSMAQAALLLECADFYTSARKCLDFVRREMWQKKRLFAIWNKGRSRFSAYLDDYAFLLAGILAMLQYRWHTPDMEFATELADVMLENFEDAEQGGYLFTPHDGESLLVRPQILHDGVTPSGYGTATLMLLRFGRLCGETRWIRSAERSLEHAKATIMDSYGSSVTLVTAAMEMSSPAVVIFLRGEVEKVARWQRALAIPDDRQFDPRRIVLAVSKEVQDCPSWLEKMSAPRHGVRAYVCQGSVCHEPVDNELDELFALLKSLKKPLF